MEMLIQDTVEWVLVSPALAFARWCGFTPLSLSALMGGMKMAVPCFPALELKFCAPTLQRALTEKQLASYSICFPAFCLNPVFTLPLSESFYLRHLTLFQSSKFHRWSCCAFQSVPGKWYMTWGSSLFIAKSWYQDLLLSAGFLAYMLGNSPALRYHLFFL